MSKDCSLSLSDVFVLSAFLKNTFGELLIFKKTTETHYFLDNIVAQLQSFRNFERVFRNFTFIRRILGFRLGENARSSSLELKFKMFFFTKCLGKRTTRGQSN